jgi:hypothetical protein
MIHLLASICLCVAGDFAQSQPSLQKPTAADRKLADAWFAERRRILNETPVKDPLPEVRGRWIAAKSGDIPPPPLEHPLAVGAIGTLQGGKFRLVRRLGNTEGRVAIQKSTRTRGAARATRGKQKRLPEVVVLLRGFELSGVSPDQESKTDQCFTVTKTETHTGSSGGSRTLFVVEPFDSAVAKSLFREAIKQELDRQRD